MVIDLMVIDLMAIDLPILPQVYCVFNINEKAA